MVSDRKNNNAIKSTAVKLFVLHPTFLSILNKLCTKSQDISVWYIISLL